MTDHIKSRSIAVSDQPHEVIISNIFPMKQRWEIWQFYVKGNVFTE